MEMGKGHKKTSFFDVNAKKIYYVKKLEQSKWKSS